MPISKRFIQKQLRKNLPKLGDGLVFCTFVSHSNANAEYDPDTGITSDQTTSFPIKVIFAKFSSTTSRPEWKEQEDNPVLGEDIKGIVETLFFPDNTEPKKDDLIINLVTGVIYFVVAMNTDPYKVIYSLHLRPKKE